MDNVIQVLKQSFLNQSSGISATTLFTPSADADVRVSVYSEVDTTSGDLNVVPHINWDDNYRSNQATVGDGPGSSSGPNTEIVIHAKAGQPVTLDVALIRSVGSQTYNLYVTAIVL